MSGSQPTSRLKQFLAAHAKDKESLCPRNDRSCVVDFLEEIESMVARDAEHALASANALISHLETADSGDLAARAMRAASTATAYLGHHEDSIQLTRLAREKAQISNHPVEAARALVAGMQALCKTGRIDEAITDGEQARIELLEAKEPILAARVDLNLGSVLKVRGEIEQAMVHLGRVIDVLPEDDPIRPHALNTVGECRLVLDDHVGADAAFKDAADLLGEDGGLATAIIIGNRADVAAREGRLQEAIDLYADARQRCAALGAQGQVARLMVEAAEALEHSGLLDEALAELESALPMLEAAELAFETARGLLAMGRLHLRARRHELACECLHSATLKFHALGNNLLANRSLLAAAEACILTQRLDEAAVRLAMVARDIDGPFDKALLAHHEGLLHEAKDDFPAALQSAQAAYQFAEPLQIQPLLVDLKARLSQLLRKTGKLDAAIESGRVATEKADAIRSGFQGNRLRAAFLASRIAAHESYVAALIESGSEKNTQLAFETVERARSRGLIERISQHLDGMDLRTTNDSDVTKIRTRLNALYAALANDGFEDQRRLQSTQRQREIDALEIKLDRRLVELEQAAPAIDLPLSTDDVFASLPKGTALIEYFLAGGRMIAFTILDSSLQVTQFDVPENNLENLVTELHFQCRRRLRGEPGPMVEERMQTSCDSILQQLHDSIVAPLPKKVREANRWLVIPHGPLVAVPFHALMDGNTYLLDRTTIATAPSAAAAIRLADAKDRGEGTLVATVGDELAPSIREEGDAVAAIYSDAQRIEENSATASAVLDALTRVRIAHIACHGRFLAGSPRSSGLRLADRWLTVRDIHELKASPPIVILSGCETGLHPRDGADELLGLTRGFAAGGSRAVVASLWSVHDAASTRLMTRMHQHLANKYRKPDFYVSSALRDAQLELRSERPHPAFWAPFFCSECPPMNEAPVTKVAYAEYSSEGTAR